jgi:hypothetical protein
MKKCRYCHKSYPESDFGVAKTTKEKVYRRQKCRYCYRKTKNILKANRRQIIDQTKSSKGCIRCGITDSRVLEFHHKGDSPKSFNIADYYYTQYSADKLIEEIAKCDVICANCHRILHAEERNGR